MLNACLENEMVEEKEKKIVEKETEEKKKEVQWWQRLNPIMLGGFVLIGFLIVQNISIDEANRSTYMIYLIVLVGIVYLLAQVPKAKEDEMITPKESELLVERECERKRRWGQFGPMTKYEIGPVSNIFHNDATGVFYDVAVEVISPYDRPKYYTATVMAKGIEKGFVYLNESIGPMSGREKPDVRVIVPNWLKDMEKRPLLEKMFFK